MDMTSMITTEEVLKQDALGRVRVPLERRHAILAEFVKSGSSAAQFARLVGIKYQTFCCWVQKQRRERRLVSGPTVAEPVGEKDQVTQGGRVRLFEALVKGDKSSGRQPSGLVVELPVGSRMEIGSPVQAQMAAELVVLIAQRAGNRC